MSGMRCERHTRLASEGIDVAACGDCHAANDIARWRRKADLRKMPLAISGPGWLLSIGRPTVRVPFLERWQDPTGGKVFRFCGAVFVWPLRFTLTVWR